jgi:hypothetical protein
VAVAAGQGSSPLQPAEVVASQVFALPGMMQGVVVEVEGLLSDRAALRVSTEQLRATRAALAQEQDHNSQLTAQVWLHFVDLNWFYAL